MQLTSVEQILKNQLKINSDLLKAPSKVKKLHITNDGDIIDNEQLSNDFVDYVLDIRNKKVIEWATTSSRPCKFIIEIFSPCKEDKFVELISMCRFRVDSTSNLSILYMDNITVFDSNENKNNGKIIPINYIQPFLFYLKNNGLISDITFSTTNLN